MHRNINKITTFTLSLLIVGFLHSRLPEIWWYIECHLTWQFRSLLLPVLDVLYCAPCAQSRGKSLCKTSSPNTVTHSLHNPTVSWMQNSREARNSEYLLTVNNTQQKHINRTRGSMFITWSAISPRFPSSAISVTFDIPNFKTGHLISAMKPC
jgi:hypothetical protein